jgi:hypothetical protein
MKFGWSWINFNHHIWIYLFVIMFMINFNFIHEWENLLYEFCHTLWMKFIHGNETNNMKYHMIYILQIITINSWIYCNISWNQQVCHLGHHMVIILVALIQILDHSYMKKLFLKLKSILISKLHVICIFTSSGHIDFEKQHKNQTKMHKDH